jgi:hypothetical protein
LQSVDAACYRGQTLLLTSLHLLMYIRACQFGTKQPFSVQIHRMRIRLDTLKREQDVMIQEMERSVMKREQIAVRFKVRKSIHTAMSR